MPVLSPIVIMTFVASIIFQIIGLSLLPRSAGFTQPWPTVGVILAFIAGIWLMARLSASGVPISLLLPLSAAVVPLVIVFIGVLLYGEPATARQVALLVAACLLIGVASAIR